MAAPTRLVVGVVVAVASVLAFLPVLGNGFVDWDDPLHVVDNPRIQALDASALRWMWTTAARGHYMPLTWLSYAVQYRLWGLAPIGYHVTSVLLHSLTALLVMAIASALFRAARGTDSGGDPGVRAVAAGLAALLFAWHPLRVEAVSWVSAQQVLLSGALMLGALLTYIVGCQRASGGPLPARTLGTAIGLFTLASLARSTAVVLPAILLVLDVFPLGRLGPRVGGWRGPAVRHVWREKALFALVALLLIPIAVVTRVSQVRPTEVFGLPLLVAASVFAVWRSFVSTLWPARLGPIQELWPARATDAPFLVAGAGLLGVSILALAGRRWSPAPLAAWLVYLACLAPTLPLVSRGLAPLGADRYTYVAGASWAILGGAAALALRDRWQAGRLPRWSGPAGLAVVVVALGTLGAVTWHQTFIWRDSRAMWTRAVEAWPTSAVAQSGLGRLLEREGDVAGATARYETAVRLWPRYARFRAEWGRLLARQGRVEEGVAELRRAVALDPGSAAVRVTLGVILLRQGRLEEAAAEYRAALAIQPDSWEAHENLAVVLARRGDSAAAAAHHQRARALRGDPAASDPPD
jgi:hypothetical protein